MKIDMNVADALKQEFKKKGLDWPPKGVSTLKDVSFKRDNCTQETQVTHETQDQQETYNSGLLKGLKGKVLPNCEKFAVIGGLSSTQSEELATIISKCPLGKDRNSNAPLFDLAREIRGMESRLQLRFTTKLTAEIVRRWKEVNNAHLLPGHDYHAELLDKLSFVRKPAGAVLAEALACARHKPPLTQTLGFSEELQLLARLCRELQRRAGNNPFFLDGRWAARLLGVPHTSVASWLRALCGRLGVLQLVSRGVTGRASEYRYIATD
jgi:hypothetical protein